MSDEDNEFIFRSRPRASDSEEPVKLKTRPMVIQDSIIARLENALEWARKGQFIALTIAAVDKDGRVSCSWSETDDFGRMLGSVSRLQYRLNVRQDEA